MGQTLSNPATKKNSESGGNDRFCFGVSEMQGWRISMEDAHATVLDLDEGSKTSFFAVYDGHGGGTVARFAGQNVHKRLVAEEAFNQKEYDVALKKAFLGTDEDILADPSHTRDPSGCTAVAALVTPDKIYVANAGDSRSVISIRGEVKALSFDHKPTSEVEKSRIHGAGGYIEFGRVNGNLALSRALGDFEFKKNYSLTPEKQIITADPDVTCHGISDEDEFFVMACDGIWDCLSSQQVVDIIRRQVAEGKELSEICELICDHCLAPDTSSGAGIGCDNMTILIVAILNGRTREEWYTWIKKRVDENHGYPTPNSLPTLYSASRLMAFRQRREAQERAKREIREDERQDMQSSLTRILSETPGLRFMVATSSGGVTNDPDMFGDESDEDDSLDEGDQERSTFFSERLGLGHSDADETSSPESEPPTAKDFGLVPGSNPKWNDDMDTDEDENHSTPKESSHPETSSTSQSLPNGDVGAHEEPIPPAKGGEAPVGASEEALVKT